VVTGAVFAARLGVAVARVVGLVAVDGLAGGVERAPGAAVEFMGRAGDARRSGFPWRAGFSGGGLIADGRTV
jgi:hypothetical protein